MDSISLTHERIKEVLKKEYNIKFVSASEVFGGLSALSYKIIADEGIFFLKIYDKNLSQTSIWIKNIDIYIPALKRLCEKNELKNKILRPISTSGKNHRYEDDMYVYILFDFIEGFTVEKNPLSQDQIIQLSETLAHLHSSGDEFINDYTSIKEDFAVPFCFSLENYLNHGYNNAPDDIRKILNPCFEQLKEMIKTTISLAGKMKNTKAKMVLCHTDAHGFNLIQAQNGSLVLVDWEGLKLAPAEADLFMFVFKDYWESFYRHYTNICPQFKINKDLLSFYISRRKLEDIWAFLESIISDDLSEANRLSELFYLENECKCLNSFCF